MSPETRRNQLLPQARALGFDAVGVAPAEVDARSRARLRSFLERGEQGDMAWMASHADRRGDPKILWPEVRSVVVLGVNYGPVHDPLTAAAETSRPRVSVYAHNRDYHDLLKKRGKKLARWMAAQWDCAVKIFVDTAPVLEKALAARAGIGWFGKHTNIVSRQWGAWLFLAEIFCDREIAPDAAAVDRCGSCRRCLDICPTGAFPAPYQLDARRCISYLTIEHKGLIPEALRPAIGTRLYGCDDCLAVCPWNKWAQATAEPGLRDRRPVLEQPLESLLALDDAGFRSAFSRSPLKRLGRDRFLRNLLIAIGNRGWATDAAAVARLADDPAAVVAETVPWALAQLVGPPKLPCQPIIHES